MNLTMTMQENCSAHFFSLTQAAKGQLSAVVRKTAADLRAQMVLSFRPPKTGEFYSRGGRIHQASAEGEAPARDTGNLAEGIQLRTVDPYTVMISVLPVYGAYLEFGTIHMAPRPYMAPAIQKVKGEFSRQVQHVLMAGVK